MATVVSQHVRHLGRHPGFFNNLYIFSKMQQMSLQPQIRK